MDALTQGNPSENVSVSGPSMDIISDEDTDHPHGDRVNQVAGLDTVCSISNQIYM